MSDILEHYNQGEEQERLTQPGKTLEFVRSCQLIKPYLPTPPAKILDVGGGPGIYSVWLAEQNYEVTLIDLVPLHIMQAGEALLSFENARAKLGNALKLEEEDESVDAVLLMGPLYHLLKREERLKVWAEAKRVLKPGGYVFAAGISRFASILDGIKNNYFYDSVFVDIAKKDLETGQHFNPPNRNYFSTAYLHRPQELKEELLEAGFIFEKLAGIEGPAWLLGHLEKLEKRDFKWPLADILQTLEEEETLLGVSAHLMAIGQKS